MVDVSNGPYLKCFKSIRLIALVAVIAGVGIQAGWTSASQEVPVGSGVPPGYDLVWMDTFDEFEPDNWTIGLVDPESGDMVPGASGQYLLNRQYAGYISKDNVRVRRGALYLDNREQNVQGTDPNRAFEYTSGWVMSMHKVFFNKGYVEFRAKFPSGNEVWPALWLIAEGLVWGPEWDMWEYFGSRPDQGNDIMGLHLCYGAYPSEQWSSFWIRDFDADYDCEEWHVYGFEWTADRATWWVDGEVVRVLESDHIPDGYWPDEDMYLVLNNGIRSGAWPDDKNMPNSLVVDYVAIYERE